MLSQYKSIQKAQYEPRLQVMFKDSKNFKLQTNETLLLFVPMSNIHLTPQSLTLSVHNAHT